MSECLHCPGASDQCEGCRQKFCPYHLFWDEDWYMCRPCLDRKEEEEKNAAPPSPAPAPASEISSNLKELMAKRAALRGELDHLLQDKPEEEEKNPFFVEEKGEEEEEPPRCSEGGCDQACVKLCQACPSTLCRRHVLKNPHRQKLCNSCYLVTATAHLSQDFENKLRSDRKLHQQSLCRQLGRIMEGWTPTTLPALVKPFAQLDCVLAITHLAPDRADIKLSSDFKGLDQVMLRHMVTALDSRFGCTPVVEQGGGFTTSVFKLARKRRCLHYTTQVKKIIREKHKKRRISLSGKK